MKGKLIFNLAMSLDGYIFDLDGGYAWITGDGSKVVDDPQFNFEQFVKQIDIVVMDKRCYEQGMHLEFTGKRVLIATSQSLCDQSANVIGMSGQKLLETVCRLHDEGKQIYLYGGGVTADLFIKQDLIDEWIIGIIPIILGKGRKLFLGDNPTLPLKLVALSSSEGIVLMKYQRR